MTVKIKVRITIQWKLLNVITLGQIETYYINQNDYNNWLFKNSTSYSKWIYKI
jgi:hypothetical protein